MNSYIKLDTITNIIVQNIINNKKTSVADLVDIKTIEVSEDAISREWLETNFQTVCENVRCSECSFNSDDCRLIKFIIDAPSVVPKPKEGEWIDRDGWKFCSECDNRADKQANGVAIEPLCTNYCCECGAKMKGAE